MKVAAVIEYDDADDGDDADDDDTEPSIGYEISFNPILHDEVTRRDKGTQLWSRKN